MSGHTQKPRLPDDILFIVGNIEIRQFGFKMGFPLRVHVGTTCRSMCDTLIKHNAAF